MAAAEKVATDRRLDASTLRRLSTVPPPNGSANAFGTNDENTAASNAAATPTAA